VSACFGNKTDQAMETARKNGTHQVFRGKLASGDPPEICDGNAAHLGMF
jgi:hypothetical protein